MAEEPEGLWVSLSDLAKLRGVDKGGLSRRVGRLKDLGHLTTRAGRQGAMLINVAEFDRAVAATVDGVRALNGGGSLAGTAVAPAPPTSSDPVLLREQARRAAYDADLKYLDLQERLGRLVDISDLAATTTKIGINLVRTYDSLPGKLDDMMAACREGPAAGKRFLRDLGIELRTMTATNMQMLASGFASPSRLGLNDGETATENPTEVP